MLQFSVSARAVCGSVLAVIATRAAAQEAKGTAVADLLADIRAAREAGEPDKARTIARELLADLLQRPDRGADPTQTALWKLASEAHRVGDLESALAAFSAVLEHREQTLEETDPKVQRARGNVAEVYRRLGDYDRARAIQEQVLEAFLATRPPDHADVQLARGHLASSLATLGEHARALTLRRQALEVLERTKPAEDRLVVWAMSGLARSLMETGDVAGALALAERILEIRVRTLPNDHPAVQEARLDVANRLLRTGGLNRALGLALEARAIYGRFLLEDDMRVQNADTTLASIHLALGDQTTALDLFERQLEVRSRMFEPGHPQLEHTRGNLAEVLRTLGHTEEAMALQESVLANLTRTQSPDADDVQRARGHLATSKCYLGDSEAALELATTAHEVYCRTHPPEHSDRVWATRTLGLIRWWRGDHAGARELLEEVLATRERTMPASDNRLAWIRANLLWLGVETGETEDVVELARTCARGMRQGLSEAILAPRQRGLLANRGGSTRDRLVSLCVGSGALAAMPRLHGETLLLVETLRGLSTRAARQLHRHASSASNRETLVAMRASVVEVQRLAAADFDGPEDEHGDWLRARNRELSDAVATKERLERQLIEAAQDDSEIADLSLPELAARIPTGGVAVSFVDYVHMAPVPGMPSRWSEDERLAAFVLEPDGSIHVVPLGESDTFEALVAQLRPSTTIASRGERLGERLEESSDSTAETAARELYRLLVAPVRAIAEAETRTWILSRTEALALVPFDALMDEQGSPFGTECSIRPVVSLLDLAEDSLPVASSDATSDRDSLVVFGGIDFGATAHAADSAARGQAFAPLPGSDREATEVAAVFGAGHSDVPVVIARGAVASKAKLFEVAARARWIHLATHGYFAPETELADGAETSGGDILASARRIDQRVTELAPFALTGLALAGANRAADDDGARPGVVTAEELLTLDLHGCELVTLSACDTSVGVRQTGRGVASLSAALQGAGARYVLTSLWSVGDEATSALMTELYRRLWIERQDPHTACWAARIQAREQGAPFRDWAGWVLTGR